MHCTTTTVHGTLYWANCTGRCSGVTVISTDNDGTMADTDIRDTDAHWLRYPPQQDTAK